MHDFEEPLEFDVSCEIMMLLYDLPTPTIMKGIDREFRRQNKNNASNDIPKAKILQKMLSINMDRIEEDMYITPGENGRTYLTGEWLLRPLLFRGKMMPTIYALKIAFAENENLRDKEIVFIPKMTGLEFRKTRWRGKTSLHTSYNLPTSALVRDPLKDDNIEHGKRQNFGPPPLIMFLFRMIFFVRSIPERMKAPRDKKHGQ